MGLREVYALLFGLFLGLSLLKFGNPVVLDSKIARPGTVSDWWQYAWPPGWAVWFLIPVAVLGIFVLISSSLRWPVSNWLWILPLAWFGWQLISSARSIDSQLSSLTLLHFAGLLVCYFAGILTLGHPRSLRLIMVGLLAGFAICSARAVAQKLFEFPQDAQFLVESQQAGWTNVAPELLVQLKAQNVVISTNGVDVANPVFLQKYERGRVFGTLVYPNALAGAVLLLFPAALTFAVFSTVTFRGLTRSAVIGLTLFLGLGALFWTGSKSGWLIALMVFAVWVFRLNWPVRAKWMTLAVVVLLGLGTFTIRFQGYFAKGATSVGARFDYWRAAGQITMQDPLFGTGPGTFQRPYQRIKSPDSEMARLVHNDYLEQFSDSGIPGGLTYLGWVALVLGVLASRLTCSGREPLNVALVLGLLGWFLQGLSEFSLYIPALSWTAFLLAGVLLSLSGNEIDKSAPRP